MNDVKFFTQMTNIIKLIEGVPYADAALNPNGQNADTAIPSGHAVSTGGKFPTTPAEIRAYQQSHGLKVDGLIGPYTLTALAKDGIQPPAGFKMSGLKHPTQAAVKGATKPATQVAAQPAHSAAYDDAYAAAVKNMDPDQTPTDQPAAQPVAPANPKEQEVDPDYFDWEDEPYSTRYLDPNEPGLDSSDPNVKTWDFGAMADENPELLKKYQIASFRKNNPDAPLPVELGGPGMPSETPEYSGPVSESADLYRIVQLAKW
jgi:peptidoglycan hydrolase-like protein with peptidoglycan-binding domain